MSDPDHDELRQAFLLDRRRLYAVPRRLGHIQEADDALQDVWLKLAEHLPGDRHAPANPRAYLARMVLNTIAGYLRRDRRRAEIHRELAAILQGPPDQASTERALAGRQAVAAVAQALDALPARTRQIFLLNRVEAMTYVQIARRLGISEQTVHYHMRRAIDHLAPLRHEIYQTAPDAGGGQSS